MPSPDQTVSEPPLRSPRAQHEGAGCWLQPSEVRRLQLGSTHCHQRGRCPTTAHLPTAVGRSALHGQSHQRLPRAGPQQVLPLLLEPQPGSRQGRSGAHLPPGR